MIAVLCLLGAVVLVRLLARELCSDLTGVLTSLAVVTVTWTALAPVAVPASDVLLALAVVAAAPGLLRGTYRFRVPAPCLIAGVLVLATVLFSALWPTPQSYHQGRYLTFGTVPYDEGARALFNVLNGVKLIVALLAVPVLLSVVGRSRARIRTLMDLWAVSALASAAASIPDFVGLTHLTISLGTPFGAAGTRGSGLTNHPVHLATVCVMVLPVVLTWLSRPGRWRAGGVLGLVLVAGALVVSASRAGLAVALLVLAAGALTQPVFRRFVVLVAGPVGLLLAAYLLLEPGVLTYVLEKTRFIGSDGAGSDSFRGQVVRQALEDAALRPVTGIGYDVAADGHSVYLQAVAAGGVICLAGLVGYVTAALRTVRVRVRGRVDRLTVTLLVSVAAWLLLIVFENALAERYMYFPLAFLLAIAAVRAERPDDELELSPLAAPPAPPTARPLLSAAR